MDRPEGEIPAKIELATIRHMHKHALRLVLPTHSHAADRVFMD
jgi:hypothetical protein